eukprot:COSAG06_NODE_62407_length_265_cov_0.620482_1_plen_29_part_10
MHWIAGNASMMMVQLGAHLLPSSRTPFVR